MLTYEILDSKLTEVKMLDAEETVVTAVDEVIARFDLTTTVKTTLSSKKGSIHWHIKKGQEKGLLEVTYWPKKQQLWVDIHDNRLCAWNQEVIAPFAEQLARCFAGRAEKKSE